MFPSILQADLVSVVPIQIALWLFGISLLYFFLRYSQGGTAGADHNPIVLFLASISAEPYNTLSNLDCSF